MLRDTLAFSLHNLFSKAYPVCGPPLGLRQGHIDVKMLQNLISRSVSVKYSKDGIMKLWSL